MKKRHAFALALTVTIIIASEFILFSLNQVEREPATISRVIDGDTVVLDDGRHIRLLNINSPEKDMPNNEASKEFMESYLNKTVYIESTALDKYQRTLSRIYDENGRYLNFELVRLGLASKFLVSQSELKEFYSAENAALQNGIGIWKHSPVYGCVSAKIDYKKEFVDIIFLCNVSTQGWYAKDESRKIYKFDKPLRGEVYLFSSNGISNETTMFWNAGNVWNDDRDTLYIFDKEGNIIFSYSYGY